MGSYDVRKISDLTRAVSLNGDDLFYISQQNLQSGGDSAQIGYASKNVSFDTISKNIVAAAVEQAR